MKKALLTGILLLSALLAPAQQRVLTLEDCREMAIAQSKELDQARIQTEMAGYDRKIALANWFPKVSATGAYIYNTRDISLVNQEQSARLKSMGTTLENRLWDAAQQNATTRGKLILDQIRQAGIIPDIAAPINEIGAEIDASMHPDLRNIWLGAVTVEQPLFLGGKILYSNQMAALAEDLARSQYDMKESAILLDVDQAYWQIISIANKKKLAESYADLLHHMEVDVRAAVAAGVSTDSDALQVKVKANEADMMLTKATNGLALAKMLLCKRVGLPLDTEITLVDEELEVIPAPDRPEVRSLDDIFAARPETRSLNLASRIFDKKAKLVRADMFPSIALLGAYTISKPNFFDGYQNTWQGGMFSAGVLVRIPIFHGGETYFKYKKARAEARQYKDQLEDAQDLINLQVTQQRKLYEEALQKAEMAAANLESARENLRSATLGHEAGVVPTNTLLAAHTAWLSASSDCIDAGIELQMASASLRSAQGGF